MARARELERTAASAAGLGGHLSGRRARAKERENGGATARRGACFGARGGVDTRRGEGDRERGEGEREWHGTRFAMYSTAWSIHLS